MGSCAARRECLNVLNRLEWRSARIGVGPCCASPSVRNLQSHTDVCKTGSEYPESGGPGKATGINHLDHELEIRLAEEPKETAVASPDVAWYCITSEALVVFPVGLDSEAVRRYAECRGEGAWRNHGTSSDGIQHDMGVACVQ